MDKQKVTKETFQFLSKDGKTKIHAVKWLPENKNVHAVMQITHGMVEYIERYDEFACYLAERGYLVVGHDHLGHGERLLLQIFIRSRASYAASIRSCHILFSGTVWDRFCCADI